jgi:hypothetical protein
MSPDCDHAWTSHMLSNKNFLCDLEFEILVEVVLKSSSFWDTTPCSPLKFYRRFGRTFISGSGNKENKKLSCSGSNFLLILRPSRWRPDAPPKRRLIFNGLHGLCIPGYRTPFYVRLCKGNLVTSHRLHPVCVSVKELL